MRTKPFGSLLPLDLRGNEMASNYRLHASDATWTIIDKATDAPARLDGIPLVTMEAVEAKHMLRILDGIDRVQASSKWWAKQARKRARMLTSSEADEPVEFQSLRPFRWFNWTGENGPRQ